MTKPCPPDNASEARPWRRYRITQASEYVGRLDNEAFEAAYETIRTDVALYAQRLLHERFGLVFHGGKSGLRLAEPVRGCDCATCAAEGK